MYTNCKSVKLKFNQLKKNKDKMNKKSLTYFSKKIPNHDNKLMAPTIMRK